jgi:hypothetical protein
MSHPPDMIRGMATCIDCELEMTTAAGCTLSEVLIDGTPYARDRSTDARCGDCGARSREFHHLGCDLERCPRCRGQLISCGCWTDGVEEGEEDDDDDDEY